MSMKRRFNWLGQARVDLPHMIMVEDSVIFDWKNLWQMMQGDIPYIHSGFTLATPWTAGNPANSLQVVVQLSKVSIPIDGNGSFLVVPTGTPNEQLTSANTRVTGSFTPSATNFVAVKFVRAADSTTADLVAFWDQDAGTEFTKTVPLGLVLGYQFVINTTGFGVNAPICKVNTDAFNNIVQVQNCKQGMFRLGSGGTVPDPNHEFTYTVTPENATISTSSTADPFAGGDWEIDNFKEWMDAVMTEIKRLKGSAYWYSPGSSLTPGVNLSDMFFDSASSVITGEGSFVSSLATSGSLAWDSDVYLRGIIGPLYFRVLQSSSPANLLDEQVAYVDLIRNVILQSGATFAFTNGSPTITCSVAITDPLIVAGNWIKANGAGSTYWGLIQNVFGSTVTLTSNYLGPTALDKAVGAVRDYNMQVADPTSIVNSGNTYWFAKRDDHAHPTATITTTSRASNIVTINTLAPHLLVAGQMVIVAGVTNASFNGTFPIKDTPTGSSFRYDQTGANASSSGGTAKKGAVIYLRGLAELEQGESRQIDDNTTRNLLDYVGAQGEADSLPVYSTALGSFTTNYSLVDFENLTKGIKRVDIGLSGANANSNQDRNLKLVRGGTWSFSNPNLTWSSDAFIQVGGLPEARNRIAAGSVSLPADGDVAYVTINRTAGAPAALAVSVAQISALPAGDNILVFARKFGGGGISAGTQVGTLALTSPSQEWIDNDRLYVAGNGLLSIYDLSVTPTAPTLMGSVAITTASSLTVVSNTAYVGGFSGGAGQFHVVDVTTPSAPTVVGTLALGALEIIAEIRVIGTRAFVHTTTGIPAPTEVGDIRVIDISTPSSPTLVGSNTTYGGNLLGGNIERKTAANFLYKAGGDRVNIFDGASNSAALLADYMSGFTVAQRIAVNATHLFITDGPANQLTIHSLASPTAPSLVSTLSVASGPNQIRVLGTLAYIYHSVGNILSIIDITTPSAPTVVFSGAHVVSTFELFPNDDLVYLLGTTTRIIQAVATGGSNEVVVGSHSFRLINNESKELDAGLSIENRTYLGIPDEAQDSPEWNSTHTAPLRTIGSDSQDVTSAVASIDTEIDKFFGQLRLKAASTPSTRVLITNPDTSMLTGEKRSQQISSLLLQTDGAQIDFQTGIIYKADGVTFRGINFSPVIPAAGMYRWFSIGIVPAAANANNTLESQVLIIAASADGASATLAPKAPFSDGVLNLGQVVIFSTNGSTVSAIPQSNLIQLGVGSGSGNGSGSGVGDDLNALSFLASFTDDFSKLPDTNSPVDISATHTDSNTYSVVNQYYRLAYDASKTVTGTGTSMTLSGTPSFTVKVGDILRVGTEARRITVVTSQVLYTIESAFEVNPSAAPATVSQAVYTQDLNNYNFGGLAISDAFADDLGQILMYYQDSEVQDDKTQDNGVPPNVAYIASADGVTYSEVFIRPEDLSDGVDVVGLPTSNDQLWVRFFSNKQSGSGFVNVLGYKVFLHREASEEAGEIPKLAYTRTAIPVVGTQINCTISVVGGKTRIRLADGFTYPVGLNVPSLRILLNGQDIDRFIDGPTSTDAYYLEIDERTIDLDTDYSAFNDSLKIILDVPVVDSSEQNASNIASIDEIFEDKFQNSIDTDGNMLSPINGTPNSQQFRSDIQNRAPIPDLTQDLLPRMGVNRFPTQRILSMPKESGPNGEEVFSLMNDQYGQIRLVGDWIQSYDYVSGPIVISVLANDYIEVVFVGTGLNLMYDQVNFTTDIRVSVDGGAESGNLNTAAGSASIILTNRYYNPNIILPVVKGLTYGKHTAKIRSNVNAGTIYLAGIEILTESSQLKVPAGSAFSNGKKMTHAADESLSYNSGFESGSLGTKGGRVIVYLKPDGTVAKACTPVDASVLTLAATNHANEEVIRTHYWREFSSGRADDFGFLTTSNQNVFSILNDDTTALVGAGVSYANVAAYDGMHLDDPNDFLVITFVGSGLDVMRYETATGSETMEYFIDGVSISSASEAGFGKIRTFKLASGLPYGTHTIRIRKITQVSWSLDILGYKVYGPKKPALPNGAVELADYCVMSNFVANTLTGTAAAGVDGIGTGVLRKFGAREVSYVGAGWVISSLNVVQPGGHDAQTPVAGQYAEFTFFGTGFVRNLPNPDNAIVQINLNGVAMNTTNYPGMVSSTFGSVTFVAATGVMTDTSGSNNSGLNVSGLPLAEYTIRFTNTNGGGNGMHIGSIDVITPIHSQKFNERGALQNTLPIGSQGLRDSRSISIHEDLPENKNWAESKGTVANTGMGSIGTPVPILDMFVTVHSKGELFEVASTCSFLTNSGGGVVSTILFVDNRQAGHYTAGQSYTNGGEFNNTNRHLIWLPKGEHTVGIHWLIGGGASSMTAIDLHRTLTARAV